MSKPIAGVWTPWADVLCRICHDALPPEVTAKRKIEWPPDEKREGYGLGFCTKCGAEVWVHEDIAQLTRLQKLAGGELEQTGGMCSALTFGNRADGGTVVVTNLDGPVLIGIYHKGEWGEGQEAAKAYNLPLCTDDEDVAAIIRAAINQSIEVKK